MRTVLESWWICFDIWQCCFPKYSNVNLGLSRNCKLQTSSGASHFFTLPACPLPSSQCEALSSVNQEAVKKPSLAMHQSEVEHATPSCGPDQRRGAVPRLNMDLHLQPREPVERRTPTRHGTTLSAKMFTYRW